MASDDHNYNVNIKLKIFGLLCVLGGLGYCVYSFFTKSPGELFSHIPGGLVVFALGIVCAEKSRRKKPARDIYMNKGKV